MNGSETAVMAAQLLAPLRFAGQDRANLWRLLHELGAATEVDDALYQRFGQLVRLGDLTGIAELLAALGDPDDPREPGDIVGALIPLVEQVLEALRGLASLGASDVDDLVAPMNDPQTWRDLTGLLPGYLLGRFLGDYHPVLAAILGLLGGTRDIELPDGDAYPQVGLADIVALLGDPTGYLRDFYGWGGEFDYPALLRRIATLARATGCRVYVRAGDDGFDRLDVTIVEGHTEDGYRRLLIRFGPALDGGGVPDGVAVSLGALGSLSEFALGGAWSLGTGVDLDGAAIEVRPDGVSLTGPAPRLAITGRPETPWALLGSPTGTRLELTEASVEASVEAPAPAGDAQILARLGNPDAGTGLRLLIGATGTDSFLTTLLGGDVSVDTAFAVNASMREGVSFQGSAGFSTTIVIERAIGPVVVHRVTVTIQAAEGTIELLMTVALSAAIGPIEAAVDGLGLKAALVPTVDGRAGTLGPYDLLVTFQPPAGVGLGLDLGPVSGGGYLFLDPAAGSYAGVLDLQVLAIGINAIGIVDTKATEGDGWSLFFALYLSIPSLQLGFGFTLTGLGGLAGINRTMDTEALGAAVRSGAIDAVLFPEDPVADAPFIIDSLKSMFPPSPGRYVFGPVVRLGWGTPSLVEAEVGLVISLPDPIVMALLGSMSSILPTEDLDLVALRVDVAGVIDFGAGTLSIDAALHDSHVAQYALSGDLSLRADFLGAPDFLMALGGAHPGFDKPAGFPVMRRLSLAISAAPVVAVHFDCYFALATNSVQFGAAFGFSADVAGFGIEGGSHFDALVYFSPFEFHTSVGFYVCITAAGIDLAGVWLDASLSGPNPFLVVGTATFKLLGFKESIRVDEQIGSRRQEDEPESEDLFDDVLAALSRSEAWTIVPSGTTAGVLVAQADDLLAMPDGRISVSQRVVPLDIDIDKTGDAPSEPYQRFSLEAAQKSGSVQDWFAPGHYFTLSASEQLSAPSFELMDSGIEIGGGDPVAGTGRTGTLAFEQILRDPQLREERRTTASAAPAAAWSLSSTDYVVPGDALALKEKSYAVTDKATGAVLRQADSWSKAHQSRARKRSGGVVVPEWELPS